MWNAGNICVGGAASHGPAPDPNLSWLGGLDAIRKQPAQQGPCGNASAGSKPVSPVQEDPVWFTDLAVQQAAAIAQLEAENAELRHQCQLSGQTIAALVKSNGQLRSRLAERDASLVRATGRWS